MSNVEGRYLTILINIKNQSETIPPFIIRYSIFKDNVISFMVSIVMFYITLLVLSEP